MSTGVKVQSSMGKNLKRVVIERLLELEDFFLAVVDTRKEGVVLPDYLLDAGQPVGINLGLRMSIPIPDLELDDAGIRATLSFNRAPFACVLPWPSVIQVSIGDEHLIWITAADAEASDTPARERPKLRLV